MLGGVSCATIDSTEATQTKYACGNALVGVHTLISCAVLHNPYRQYRAEWTVAVRCSRGKNSQRSVVYVVAAPLSPISPFFSQLIAIFHVLFFDGNKSSLVVLFP